MARTKQKDENGKEISKRSIYISLTDVQREEIEGALASERKRTGYNITRDEFVRRMAMVGVQQLGLAQPAKGGK